MRMTTTVKMIGNALAFLGTTASLVWLANLVVLILHRKKEAWLARQPEDHPESGWPSLAVMFAARNEEGDVERATRSLLAQDYPALEVIAVDDRSSDGTGAILDAISDEDPRLRVVHVRDLPPGWLGKNHALQSAAASTKADWLLFTDADVVFSSGALRKSMAWAVAHGADHVTVAPEVPTSGAGERLFMAMFGLMFLLYSPVWAVENRALPAHLGIGAFNLVRASVFRAIGGLSRLALSVDDDMRLGQALKFAGYSTRVLLGHGAVSVRWQVGLGGMIRGLEKNFFAGLNFSLVKVLAGAFGLLWLGAAPHLGLLVGPWWTRALCALGVGSLVLILGFVRPGWQNGVSWYYALALPVSALLCVIALVRSAWLTLWRRGVRWRDHHYPLDALRNHVRHRNAWARELWKSTR